MKKPVVDYSKLRLNNITSPEYRHLLLLLGWPAYLIAYFLTENLIPESACHVIHSVVDDMIPFAPAFILAYTFWYFLIVACLLYFGLYDIESFKFLQIYITLTQVIAMIVYIVYPSVQHLRPENLQVTDFFTFIVSIIYAADTPTGVCPSLHVAYSIGIASSWIKKKNAPLWAKVSVTLSVVLICFSVMFVKQHSFVDVVAAIVMCFFIEMGFLIFKKLKNKEDH